MKTYIKETISKKELPWDIKKIGFTENECKTCKKEKRRNGSAYCQKCADAYKVK